MNALDSTKGFGCLTFLFLSFFIFLRFQYLLMSNNYDMSKRWDLSYSFTVHKIHKSVKQSLFDLSFYFSSSFFLYRKREKKRREGKELPFGIIAEPLSAKSYKVGNKNSIIILCDYKEIIKLYIEVSYLQCLKWQIVRYRGLVVISV